MLPTCVLSCHSYKRVEIKVMRVARQEECSLSIGEEQNILVSWCGQWFLPRSYHGIISDHNVSACAVAFFETGHSIAVTSLSSNSKALYSRFILSTDVAVLVGRWNVLRKFRSRSCAYLLMSWLRFCLHVVQSVPREVELMYMMIIIKRFF